MNKFLIILAFIALLCAPGYTNNQQLNRLICVSILVLLIRHEYKFKPQVHHYLFFAWLGWAAIGTCFSRYPMMAFYGFYPYRCDGIITYLVIVCLALCYWKTFTCIRPLCLIALLCFFTIIGVYLYQAPWLNYIAKGRFDGLLLPDVALASFACVAGIVLIHIHAGLSVIAIPVMLMTQNRTSFYAFLMVVTVYLFMKYCRHLLDYKRMMTIASCLFFVWFALYPFIPDKMTQIPALNCTGARCYWLLEASNLASALPVTGFGLDSLSNYLTHPEGPGYEALLAFIPDKTHNIAYDAILETGWIGYTLLLLAFGYALAICIKHPERQNVVCIMVVIGWILYGFANPHGLLCNAVALTAFMGIRKEEIE